MATRFKKLRTRRMKHRKALKTRRHTQRGGVTIFGKEITLPFGKKNIPVTSSGAPTLGANAPISGVNPMAKNLNARKANLTMNKIQAELNKLKQQNPLRNRGSITSDPGSV